MSNHVGAGTGGDDDWTGRGFQYLDGMLCHLTSLLPEPGVVRWLATTSLIIRYREANACRL
jgi:hypothetical protein